jgi:hypothetical protein
MTSCYKFETLPDRVKSKYEIAIPIIDTAVSIENFVAFTFPDEVLNKTEIPEGTPISMRELEYPFFIGDFSSSQKINWIQLFITLETDSPPGTTINIKIYTKDDDGRKNYFELPENNSSIISDKLTNIEQFRDSERIFFNVSITYPTKVSVAEIIQNKLNIKLAIKFEIETDLTINL